MYTVLDGNLTFDVLVLSGKSRWTSISRWEDATSAQNEARKLVSSKRHLGVKVTQENYDEAENRYTEKTVFKHLKSDGNNRESEDETELFEFGDFDDYDDGIDWVWPVFGLITVLAILLGIGIFFVDDFKNLAPATKADYFVYELPPVTTNVSSGGEAFSVRINLQLELDRSEDSKAVEFALAKIMESVIDEIRATDAGDLQRSQKLLILKSELRKKIQDAMGETNLNGVLFRDIQVF